jgi:hypothetical protein
MTTLAPFLSLPHVGERLQAIFPLNFPDRAILVGEMATRVFFVALYGGFTDGAGRYFRPSTVIRFSHEQAALTSDADRLTWLASCQAPGHKTLGKQWYADNTREPVRDDLIRNRAIPIGVITKREGIPPTSPAPIYAMAAPFAALFKQDLIGSDLDQAISEWQERHLDPMTLKRMRLLASGVKEKEGQVTVKLPTTGKILRLAAGDASSITRDVCEGLSKRVFQQPVIVHVSISDQKTFRELDGEALAVGLELNPSAELPDVVMVDVGKTHGLTIAFIEVVHSDGPITELRKKALLKIAEDAGIKPQDVSLITAFEDRNSPAFKKRVSELARGTSVWFRSEPDMLMRLDSILER